MIAAAELGARRRVRVATTLVVLATSVALAPRALCGRGAQEMFRGEAPAQEKLAREVVRAALANGERASDFDRRTASRTGGQAEVALDQMTILGLGQIVREHPEWRAQALPAMHAAAERLVDPRTLRFAVQRWGDDGITSMKPGGGYAYLGYINLALGMLRAIDPQTRYRALNDRLTAALAERLDSSPTGLIETYPGETWPPDVAAVAASIGLHAAVTGVDRSAFLSRWSARFVSCALSPSGYLVQRVRSGTCTPLDAPRGSGTAIASYFLGFADAALSKRLYDALSTSGRISRLGFGGVREYLDGFDGRGDGNSGPIVFGASVGATGYTLGAARAHGDLGFFRELYRSATLGRRSPALVGADKLHGGPALRNALLLAMMTANRIE